jgi:hypothetical protein
MTAGSPFGRGERDPLYVALAGATSQSSSGGVLSLRQSGELTFQFESSKEALPQNRVGRAAAQDAHSVERDDRARPEWAEPG